MIPYGRQDINQADVDAVVDILNSDFLTQGPSLPRFEQLVAKHVGAEHAVAVSNATSALHIACLALGLGPGDYVWTSPITFVASANCALYCGAKVNFVDIDPKTYNICPKALARKLEEAERHGTPLPKIVIAVHLCGQSCDMEAIHLLSQKYGFKVIEDASHAIGGKYRNQPIGNGRFSHITVFSFHPVKIITTGEGGMALTNCSDLAHKMELFRSHGITRNSEFMTHAPDGPWYYQQIQLGYNYRMTELQAALGISQMKRLNDFIYRRHLIANRYDDFLRGLPLVTPWQHPDSDSSRHLYVIRLKLDLIDLTHRQVFEVLSKRGVGVNLHYIPLHLQPYFSQMGFGFGDFPEAESYYSEAISLPIFYRLSDVQQTQIIDELKKVLNR